MRPTRPSYSTLPPSMPSDHDTTPTGCALLLSATQTPMLISPQPLGRLRSTRAQKFGHIVRNPNPVPKVGSRWRIMVLSVEKSNFARGPIRGNLCTPDLRESCSVFKKNDTVRSASPSCVEWAGSRSKRTRGRGEIWGKPRKIVFFRVCIKIVTLARPPTRFQGLHKIFLAIPYKTS